MHQTNARKFKKILVTGGAGFIGLNFCHFLSKSLDGSSKVTVIDNLSYASNPNEINRFGFDLRIIDICDRDALEVIFKEASQANEPFDLIVNFAAESHVDQSIKSPQRTLDTNVGGVLNLLDCLRLFSKEAIFLQISTDEVYGDKENGESIETDSLLPSSPYSATKAAADLLVLAYTRTYGLKTFITRCTNNFGKYQNPEKLIPRIIWKAIRNEDIPLYGSGEQSREWIFVEDHIKAIWKVVEYGEFGEVYNVGSSNRKTNLELTKMILSTLSSDSKIRHIADRPGHDTRYAVSTKKISEELGWISEANFNNEITNVTEWYVKQYAINKEIEKQAIAADEFYGDTK